MNRSDDIFPQPGGTPDPYWQRAFDDAYDTPPPRVWEGVERQLELDESDGILPLWQHRQGRQSMLFGRWAAGIAASLLLTVLGWWAWHREDAIRPDVTVALTTAPSNTPGTLPTPTVSSEVSAENTGVRTRPVPRLASTPPLAHRQVRSHQPATTHPTAPDAPLEGTFASSEKLVNQLVEQEVAPATSQFDPGHSAVFTQTTVTSTLHVEGAASNQAVAAGIQPSTMRRSFMERSVTMQSVTIQSRSAQLPPNAGQPMAMAFVPASEKSTVGVSDGTSDRIALAVNPLRPKALVIRPLGNDRIVWYNHEQPLAEPTLTKSKKQKERPWLSASVAASSFSPNMVIRSSLSPVAYAVNSAYNSFVNSGAIGSAATLQNQIGRAVAFQAGIGIPLNEHWSVETGLGYLNGQSDVKSPTRISTLTLVPAPTDNLYSDLVARLVPSNAAYASNASKAQYDAIANQASNYSTSQQTVSNSYQFVQVPVQVGYEFRPRRKFGLALLTGMVSNWFVRNTVAESITIKPGDGVYRPVTMAGTAGMRLRYRPDNVWSASVAGTFQQSLQSITHTDVSLQATPQQVGLSFSVDRHF